MAAFARQSRDCRETRRQSPQVEPVRCGESPLGGFADSHATALAQRSSTLLSVTRRGVPSVVATGVAEPFGNRSWGKPPRPRCLTTVLSPQRTALPLRETKNYLCKRSNGQ
ncbi:hypothetical protein LC593_28830 [Nostoc sp. CHAB 5844]|nr:hypothetical protein [Nostoc sp. CHAB 5844]